MRARPFSFCLALFLLGRAAIADAGVPEFQSTDTIRLLSRSWAPPEGIEPALGAEVGRPGGADRIHVILQLRASLSDRERAEVTRLAEVRLLDAIPGRAYFASVPRDLTALRRSLTFVRWAGLIRPTDKYVAAAIENPPAAARHASGRLRVVVRFFRGVPQRRQLDLMRAHEASEPEPVGLLNGIAGLLSRDALLRLAADDEVQWIEPHLDGPQLDNDGVRGVLGIDSEAVESSTAYALSGAGVTVANWDWYSPSLKHVDLTGRVSVGDGAIPVWTRNAVHAENGTENGAFDAGEAIYVDVDDSQTVTAGDWRLTAVGAYPARSLVVAGNSDVTTKLALFTATERFVDAIVDGIFTDGDPIYVDSDGDGRVSGAEAPVSGAPAPAGEPLLLLTHDGHAHATMVSGTIAGNGAGSLAALGSDRQWRGVAAAARLRAYHICTVAPCFGTTWLNSLSSDLVNALANGASVATNAWTAHLSHCHQLLDTPVCYDGVSGMLDAVTSGRQSDGSALGLARLLPVGSAGNRGAFELHSEDGATAGAFDAGESIYLDRDGDEKVSPGDLLLGGGPRADGTPLIPFAPLELHAESVSDSGSFEVGEGVYADQDASGSITIGDRRIEVQGFAAGSVVALGDADLVGTPPLRRFIQWGTTGTGNGAKNGLQVGAVATNATVIPAWSSRGPTIEGRMKPDLVVAGTETTLEEAIRSTYPRDGYGKAAGTSMSAGAAAGAVALVDEFYRAACKAAPVPPEIARAVLIHAAADVVSGPPGTNPGPDFVTGFGRLRVRGAIDLVPHHAVGVVGVTASKTLTIGASQSLRVTLVWNDPPWTPNAAPGDHGVLHNDLDLVLVAPDGRRHTPWVLDPGNPLSAASRGSFAAGATIPGSARDSRNTVEQVQIDAAAPGTWTIEVTSSQLALGPQEFVLVSEALPPSGSPCTATPAADVWMRDNDADTGVEPSVGGILWISPDVWNRNSEDGAAIHQNPEFGEDNFLYANVRNRSAEVAEGTTVEFWVGDAATGLQWPASFTLVGRIFVPRLAPGEVRQVGALRWNPPAPLLSSHYCMYLRVLSAQDPAGAFVEVSGIGLNARASNSRVYRNLEIVDLHSSRSVTFVVRNILETQASIDLGLTIPPAFLPVGSVHVRLSPNLERGWGRDARSAAVGVAGATPTAAGVRPPPVPSLAPPGGVVPATPGYAVTEANVRLPGLSLQRGEYGTVTITFYSAQATPAAYPVDATQSTGGRIDGGIRYIVRTGAP